MSVVEAVRFKSLSNQLSKNEKQKFILKLLNKPNDIITESLFNYFSIIRMKQLKQMILFQQSFDKEKKPQMNHQNID